MLTLAGIIQPLQGLFQIYNYFFPVSYVVWFLRAHQFYIYF